MFNHNVFNYSYRKLLVFISISLFLPSISAANKVAKSTTSQRESLAQVVAVVGNVPITSITLAEEVNVFKKRRGVRRDRRNIKSQVLDLLISRAVVDFVAISESVTVSGDRINATIEKEMKVRGVKTKEIYKKFIKRSMGVGWAEYRRELRRQLKTQQVVQLRVSVPNPSLSQVQEWYKLNKKKVGSKYLVRLIYKKFIRGNSRDELRVSRLMGVARREAVRNFAAAARKYSEHSSKNRGGLVGWVRLDELVRVDEVLAGAIHRTRPGRVSTHFKGRTGYYIAKVDAIKAVSLEEVYEQVRALLYSQNEQAAFANWIRDQRNKISVNVFLDGYKEL